MASKLVIIDDEPALLRLMEMYLTKLGYEVHACSDGASAKDYFQSEETDIDVLVIDLTLPDVSGEELGIQMAREYSSLRVLICSGYPFNVSGLPEDVRKRFASLQKPFLPNMLAECVASLLGQVVKT